jgi:hypothetical protein
MTSLERLAAIGFGARLTKAQTAEDAAEIARLRRRVATLGELLKRVEGFGARLPSSLLEDVRAALAEDA